MTFADSKPKDTSIFYFKNAIDFIKDTPSPSNSFVEGKWKI